MPEYRVPRGNLPDLVFDGECLSHKSSRTDDSQRRWQEIAIYRTNAGLYVTFTVGRSIVDGERDRINTAEFAEPSEVWRGLTRAPRTETPYMTALARSVLDEAVEKDPALDASRTQRI